MGTDARDSTALVDPICLDVNLFGVNNPPCMAVDLQAEAK